MEQKYMKEREIEKNHFAQQPLWLLKINTSAMIENYFPINNEKRKKHFLQHQVKQKYQRKQVKEHRKGDRLCNSIHKYHQKNGFA